MLKIMLLTFGVLLSTVSFADNKIACNANGNQLEMNACAEDEFVLADKELNSAYQSLVKKEANEAHFIKKLKVAQNAWIKFRDTELDALFACSEPRPTQCWGSAYLVSFLNRKTELTRDRTKQLKRMLTEGRGQ